MGSNVASTYASYNATNLAEQGRPTIPAQAYLDGYVGFHSRLHTLGSANPNLDIRLGVHNILDKRAVTVVPPLAPGTDEIGYSPLGDPRGRRFVLDVTASF